MKDIKAFTRDRAFVWTAWRRHIHHHPELSGEETETLNFIKAILDDMELDYHETSNGGVIVDIPGEEPGPVIAFRADVDALPIREEVQVPFRSKEPGVMHACGHDVHTAILLGICDYFTVNTLPKGHIKCFFQPAEEAIGGGEIMVREGAMENPKTDMVFGLHVNPDLPAGAVGVTEGVVNASTDEFVLKVKGVYGHGAHPDSGVDGILIAAEIITAFHHLTGRLLDPTEPAVITLGMIQGGLKSNILAEDVSGRGTLRTIHPETRKLLMERMELLAKNIGEGYGGSAEIQWIPGYIPLLNDDRLVEDFYRLAVDELGEDKVEFRRKPSMGGDDFAYFAAEAPGLYYDLGSGFPDRKNPPAHSPLFEVNEECIPLGVYLQLTLAKKYLNF